MKTTTVIIKKNYLRVIFSEFISPKGIQLPEFLIFRQFGNYFE
jgi:O-phosphoseryl-tRNA(Cys) synthetase